MNFISGQKIISELHFESLKFFLESNDIEYQLKETPILVNPTIGLFKTEWEFLFDPNDLDDILNKYSEHLVSTSFWNTEGCREYREFSIDELKELLITVKTPIIELVIAENLLKEYNVDFSDIKKVQNQRDKEEFNKHINSVSSLLIFGYILAFFTGLIGLLFANYIKSQCNRYYKGQDKEIQLKYITKANSLQNFSLIMVGIHLARLLYVYAS